MNFALLGDDPAVVPLVRAIAAHPAHALTRAVLVDDADVLSELLRLAPSARIGAQWDELLVARDVDAVIACGATDAVLEAAKQIAAAGKPLVVHPDARQGSQWIYELTLIRDDTHVPLVPMFRQRMTPAHQRLREIISSGDLGRLLHVQCERAVPADGASPLLEPSQVERHLLEDADLLRSLGGDYDQVTALYSGTAAGRLSLATVTLAGSQLPEALWSLRPTGPAGLRWQIVGERGRMELSGGDGPDGPQQLVVTIDGRSEPATVSGDWSGDVALEQIERGLRGEAVEPTWTDLTRAFEIVDAARRSVRRRRTIDLHFETTSERSQFKTQMTAIGCGVLVFTFLAVLAVLLLGAVFGLDPAAMRVARLVAFLPLFVYLVLQLLLFVSRPPLAARDTATPDERHDSAE